MQNPSVLWAILARGQHAIQKIALAGLWQGWLERRLASLSKAQRKASLAEIVRLAANLVKPTSETNELTYASSGME